MSSQQARRLVRQCLQGVCPRTDFSRIDDDTDLLHERLITSFQVVDLILQIEQARGRGIRRSDLEPGCFRDIAAIAEHFFTAERDS